MRRTPTSLREALRPRRVLAMPITITCFVAATCGAVALGQYVGHTLAPDQNHFTEITPAEGH